MAIYSALSVVLIVLALVIIILMLWSSYSFAPWIPSNINMVKEALHYINPDKRLRFVDLGCGDGRTVFLANKLYNLKADGFEISPVPFCIAWLRQLKFTEKPIRIKFKNLFNVDLANYDIIYIYGLPENINDKLFTKLTNEVKTGTFVISNYFKLKQKTPLKVFREKWRSMYVYQF